MNRRGFLGLLAGAAATKAVTYFLPPIGGWSSDVIAHAPLSTMMSRLPWVMEVYENEFVSGYAPFLVWESGRLAELRASYPCRHNFPVSTHG